MNPYVKLLRIRGWYAFLCTAILGFVISGGVTGPLVDILIFFLMVSVFLGFSFSINDSFDVAEDLQKKSRSNPVATGEVSQDQAVTFSYSLALAGTILSAWFGPVIFFYYVGLTLLSFFYSAPPLRFKSRFPFDLLSHGLFFGSLILLLPALIFGSLNTGVLLIAISIFFLSVTIELWNHIEDYESDVMARLKTTVCVLGLEKSERIAKALAVFFPLTLVPLYHSGVYFLPFVISTSVYVMIFIRKARPAVLYSYANLLYGVLLVLALLSSC
ncbi:MAG: UbiA prenyltransferase family protein [Candidatus Thorarchaeota archaeon]|nr:MAG: UbiA prenyltransferase family protein [Candidatus Thorarchaeota archaeon]